MKYPVTLLRVCQLCKEYTYTVVERKDIDDWKNGKLMPNDFPYLSSSEKEILISGYCGDCFDTFFEDIKCI